ncbi:MAG: glycosyltransferase [Caldilineaceae bacterium]|nr:glycosyltransferase [Caldilineaceae bacterium]
MNSIVKVQPDFSIIVPAYNQARYLGATIESVLIQEYERFELLVVDDGSTDNTQRIAKSFVDHRLRYLHQPNAGLSAARNTGIAHATGRYLIFLDSDDFLEPSALLYHKQAFARNPKLGVSVGGWRFVNPKGRAITDAKAAPSQLDLPQLLMGNPFPVNAAAVDRSWLGIVNHFDPALQACEDWDFWLRLATVGCHMASFEQPVCAYRMHPGQMTRERERMHTARLTVLNKAFQTKQAQDQGATFRARCFAAAHAKTAARAYYVGDVKNGKYHLERAIGLDPALVDENAQALMWLIAGWSSSPHIEDPLAYITSVYSNLPENALLWTNPNQAIGRIAIQMAFEAFQRCDWPAVSAAVMQGIRHQPSWLTNRGVLSIFMRSLWKRSSVLA